MEVQINCKLDPQLVLVDGVKRPAWGLSELHVCPDRVGLGRQLLANLENWAEKEGFDLIVGWAADDVIEFYEHCGWYVADNVIVSQIDGLKKRAVWWSSRLSWDDGPKIEPFEKDW